MSDGESNLRRWWTEMPAASRTRIMVFYFATILGVLLLITIGLWLVAILWLGVPVVFTVLRARSHYDPPTTT
jgi:hypothetical protein